VRIGRGGRVTVWVVGWLSLTVGLALLARLLGPGAVDRVDEPPDMVYIAAGTGTMGAEGATKDEGPIHEVTLAAFGIDRLPITNAQFAAFLNAIGRHDDAEGSLYAFDDPSGRVWYASERYMAQASFERFPVVGETWLGAREYCAWRGARLPTEAEWERAARGAVGRIYAWGDEPPDISRARFAFRLYELMPVGSYPAGATPDGLLDMAGNVTQWTSTLYRPYPYRADDGREDPTADGARVTRGGSYNASGDMLRASYRGVGMVKGPVGGRPPIGFRCARGA
jgi:formylglycine-generating enzyme required for sulfatase activity